MVIEGDEMGWQQMKAMLIVSLIYLLIGGEAALGKEDLTQFNARPPKPNCPYR